LPISSGHRVVMDAKIDSELANRGELVARAEKAGQEHATQAPDDLLGSG